MVKLSVRKFRSWGIDVLTAGLAYINLKPQTLLNNADNM